MPPKVRTPRFCARPSREITSPCFSRLIVLSALFVSLLRPYRIKSIAGRLRHLVYCVSRAFVVVVIVILVVILCTLVFSRHGLREGQDLRQKACDLLSTNSQ